MKRVTPVSAITYAMARSVLRIARHLGRDEVEELNRSGLLLTPEQELRIKVETMEYVLAQLNEWSPAQFLRRRHRVLETTTQVDLQRCIMGWLQDHIEITRGTRT